MKIIEDDYIYDSQDSDTPDKENDEITFSYETEKTSEEEQKISDEVILRENSEQEQNSEPEEIYSDSSLDPSTEIFEEEQEEISEEDIPYSEDEYGQTITQEETQEETEKMNFFVSLWKNKRRRAKLAYALVTFVLIIIGTGYGVVSAVLGQIESGEEEVPVVNELGEPIVYDEEDFESFTAVSSASSLNDYIDQWYDSGVSMYSKNVINVLLVGLDSKDGLTTGDSRSDTMMIVSLNTKTKKISMVSLFRDTWAKFIPSDSTVHFGKMNGSYRYGGINCTVQTIEKMFKIRIDHYAIVDFRNFKKLVNAVGGVDLYVQEYEAKNMKREWNLDVPFSQSEDDLVHLDGEQAFWFARQRHCDADADVSRTRRQRQVITAFIDSCKGASFSQLSDALNEVFKFVKTDLKKSEILSYATKALAWGWINYPIETVNISDSEVFQTPTIKGQSIVVQDYPKVTQIIQQALYGSTNVVLEEGRRIVFSLY